MFRIALLGIVVALGCGGAHTPPPKPKSAVTKPKPTKEAKAAADAIAHTFQLLAIESAMPADPEALRGAAIEALAPRGWKARPLAWTGDTRHDVEVLRGAVLTLAERHELAKNAVLRAARAMAIASGDTQTFALERSSLQALFAIIGGGPVVQPGMLIHRVDDGRWAVGDVMAGSAAEAAGVRRGDILVTIDDVPVVHGYTDFIPFLGVAEGTKVTLVVERGGENKELVLALKAVASPIVEHEMLAGGVGYIRLTACTHSDDDTKDAGKLVAAALAELDKKHARSLVLDLRGNAGGFPFDVISLFTDADPLLYAISPDGAETPVARTKVPPWKTKRPIAVIMDELTAAGAEMIALALRDHAKAILVGRPTAGALSFPTTEKLAGDVTLSYPLSRVGSSVDHKVFEGNRLEPELAVANPTAAEYAEHKDPQLDAAIAALRGRRVR